MLDKIITFFGDLFNIQVNLRRRGRCVGKSLISETLACPRRSDSIGRGKIDGENKKGRMKPRCVSKKEDSGPKRGSLTYFFCIYFNIILFIYLLMVFID